MSRIRALKSRFIGRLLLFLSMSGFQIFLAEEARAAEWQWSVPVKTVVSSETNDHPRAFLWIPPDCRQVRGVVVGQHNMLEEGIFEHAMFRKKLASIGFAEVWVSPNWTVVFDYTGQARRAFEEMMGSLAEVSGYSELARVPVIPFGHSAEASFPWNFGAELPERTLAMVSVHGDAPLTDMTGSGKPNPDWGGRTIDGIPGLMVMGEYEWLEGRIQPAIAFRKRYPQSALAFLADAGRGHFDYSDDLVRFLAMFIEKVADARLPKKMPLNTQPKMFPIDPAQGWLVDRWRKDQPLTAAAAPFKSYKGNKEEAFWAIDKEMAQETEAYYNKARGKLSQYIGFVQNGTLLPGAGSFTGYRPVFTADSTDGLTFHVSAAFVDTLQGKELSSKHAPGKIKISRICGPVKQLDDTTFTVRFYRMGLNNPKRTGDIWLLATQDGDDKYKSVVQQANFKIPLRNTRGIDQSIEFLPLEDLRQGLKSVRLSARSTSGLPVYYYVKEGPAEVEGDMLTITAIPPRSKYPLRITVVAWQWGKASGAAVKSAEPVERSFYIVK